MPVDTQHLDIDSLGKPYGLPGEHTSRSNLPTHTEEVSQVMGGREHVQPATGRQIGGILLPGGDGKGPAPGS